MGGMLHSMPQDSKFSGGTCLVGSGSYAYYHTVVVPQFSVIYCINCILGTVPCALLHVVTSFTNQVLFLSALFKLNS